MSRSTWACELKCCFKSLHIIVCCHAPRERVSWNRPKNQSVINPPVTLHVSVWVEIDGGLSADISAVVTLHVSVWVEIRQQQYLLKGWQVTLHVSVWVEICTNSRWLQLSWVTLHVSVWVEIYINRVFLLDCCVTLHVSVWVEIEISFCERRLWMSRSTWACESIFVSTQDLGCTLSAQITASAVWCSKLAVKDVYPEFNWRKGGYVHGRRKWYSHEVKKRRKSWVSCLP